MQRAILVPAHWNSLDALVAFVDAIDREELLAADQAFVLRLVIEEIVTNLIKYGYDEAAIEGLVEVKCTMANDTLAITIRDRGRPFDPRDLPEPDMSDDVQQRVVGGLGIYLVRELVDEIVYHHDAASGWNELVIHKRHADLDLVHFLRHNTLFDGFSDADLAHLAGTAEERMLPEGALLFVEGQPGDDCCVLVEGRLQVLKQLGDDELLLDTRQPGQIVGEMALLDNSPRSATVRAACDCRVLMLTKANFYELLTRNPPTALELLRGGTARLRTTSQKMTAGLEAKNAELLRAYEELKGAQDELLRLERIEQELQIARRIQQAFLPQHIPQPPGWQLSACNYGAQEVGGDFYDCIPLPGGLLGLVVADVCGKGVPAALFVALTRSLLRAASQAPEALGVGHALSADALLSKALGLTNRYIAVEHAASSMFITLFYGLLDPRSGLLRYVNAGHNPPLLVRRDAAIEELEANTIPLGIMADLAFETRSVCLERGDMLVLFTDGVTESFNSAGVLFDDQQLLDVLRVQAGKNALEVRLAIEAAVAAHVGDEPAADDMTLLVVSHES